MKIKLRDGSSLSQKEEIHDRLKALRLTTGLNQRDMGAKLGLSDRAYKNYELGIRELPLTVFRDLVVCHSLDAEWFLFGDDGRPDIDQ